MKFKIIGGKHNRLPETAANLVRYSLVKYNQIEASALYFRIGKNLSDQIHITSGNYIELSVSEDEQNLVMIKKRPFGYVATLRGYNPNYLTVICPIYNHKFNITEPGVKTAKHAFYEDGLLIYL